jgi:MFS family permease
MAGIVHFANFFRFMESAEVEFLRSRGLNQLQMNSVLATYFAVTFLTDVPTGAFADALGRRKSFILGCAARASAFLVYFFAHYYFVFLIAETIDGIGTTFCNGAIDAWGVDALDDAGFDQVKDRLFSRISQLSTIGFMISSVIGAHVANVNIAWPWLLGAAGYLISGLVGSLLMTGERPRETAMRFRGLGAMLSARVAQGLRQGFGRRTILLLSAAGAIQIAAWAPFWMEWPLLFSDRYGVGVWIIGYLWSMFAIARMIGAEAIARFGLRSADSGRALALTMLTSMAGLMLFLAGSAAGRPNLALGILFAMNLCTGAMGPLAQSWFNEQIESKERATLLSFNSTLGTLGGSVGAVFGGWAADAFGIPAGWQLAGVITLGSAACYFALRARAAEPGVAIGVAK